jgi:site-specific recombinase XerD
MRQISTAQPHERLNANFLESFAASWRAEGLAEQTLQEYLRHLRGFARYLDGNLLDATRHDLESHVTAEMNRLSPASAAYTTRALKRFYRWLREEQEIEVNPAERLKTPKVPEPVTKIAAQQDVFKMMSLCRPGKMFASFNERRDLALIHMLRSGGLRVGEASRVQLQDIDVSMRAIVVRKSKTGKPRIAAVDGPAARAISAYIRRLDPSDTGVVWRTEDGAHLTLDGVKQAFERRANRAEVDVTPHQVRRAFAGDFMRRGGSQTALQALAGWSSPRMVDRYLGAQRGEIALAEHRRLYPS